MLKTGIQVATAPGRGTKKSAPKCRTRAPRKRSIVRGEGDPAAEEETPYPETVGRLERTRRLAPGGIACLGIKAAACATKLVRTSVPSFRLPVRWVNLPDVARANGANKESAIGTRTIVRRDRSDQSGTVASGTAADCTKAIARLNGPAPDGTILTQGQTGLRALAGARIWRAPQHGRAKWRTQIRDTRRSFTRWKWKCGAVFRTRTSAYQRVMFRRAQPCRSRRRGRSRGTRGTQRRSSQIKRFRKRSALPGMGEKSARHKPRQDG